MVLIPGLAFAKNGLRLGYGKGVYDRLLINIKTLKIAVAYDFQIIDYLEGESHDLKVDFIITEQRVFTTHNI